MNLTFERRAPQGKKEPTPVREAPLLEQNLERNLTRTRTRTTRKRRPGSPPPPQPTAEHLTKRERARAAMLNTTVPEDYDPTKWHARPDMLGNRLWMMRDTDTPRAFSTPEDMAEAARAYFEWVQENPLYEYKATHYQGSIVRMSLPKMRAMSIKAFCLHAGIAEKTWVKYREREEYLDVIKATESAIFTQKFEAAAADLLNSNVIIRDLSLRERLDVTSGDESITEIRRTIISDESGKGRDGG